MGCPHFRRVLFPSDADARAKGRCSLLDKDLVEEPKATGSGVVIED
jgi:hypothetical protein